MKNKISGLLSILRIVLVFLIHLNYFGTRLVFIKNYGEILELFIICSLVLIVLIKLLKYKYGAKKVLLFLLLTAFSIVSYLVTKNSLIPVSILFLISANNRRMEDIVREDLIAKIACFAILALLNFMNFIDSGVFLRDTSIRESFGFVHPNTAGYMAMSMFADILVISSCKKSILVIAAATSLIALLADSRTSLMIIIALLITRLIIANKISSRQQKTRKRLVLLLPLMVLALSIFSTYRFIEGDMLARNINTALSGRLTWQSVYYQNEKISMFGNNMDYKGRPLDNAYYRIIYSNGIIGLIFFISILTISLKRAYERKDMTLSVLMLLTIYSLSEWLIFRIPTSPLLTLPVTKGKELK